MRAHSRMSNFTTATGPDQACSLLLQARTEPVLWVMLSVISHGHGGKQQNPAANSSNSRGNPLGIQGYSAGTPILLESNRGFHRGCATS